MVRRSLPRSPDKFNLFLDLVPKLQEKCVVVRSMTYNRTLSQEAGLHPGICFKEIRQGISLSLAPGFKLNDGGT
jgi:hypothetical protein